jgi:predicted acetyltransferase
MSAEIRTVAPDEFEAFVEAVSTGFLDRPNVARVAELVRPWWEPGRTWGAWDGSRFVGTFRSWATEITVPGGARLSASAVSAVTVSPTHRRQGLLTRMTAAEHGAIRERGEALGLLYASEYPIYGRFGYGPATRTATWTLSPRSTSFTGAPVSGVELASPGPETRDTIRDVFDAWRLHQPGEIRRRPFRWDDDLGLVDSPWGETWKGFLALHRDGSGAVDGYVRYRGEEKWVDRQPSATLRVNELHALTPESYRALWRYIGEIDLVGTIVAEGRAPSEQLPWLLTNHRAAVPSDMGEALWVRIFDVARALEARTYERTGSLVLEVVDREAGEPLRVALDVTPDGATCRATDRSPDLTLPVAALGAAYLGGTRLRDIVIGTGADEHRQGALQQADALLRTADEPWCSTFF